MLIEFDGSSSVLITALELASLQLNFVLFYSLGLSRDLAIDGRKHGEKMLMVKRK